MKIIHKPLNCPNLWRPRKPVVDEVYTGNDRSHGWADVPGVFFGLTETIVNTGAEV